MSKAITVRNVSKAYKYVKRQNVTIRERIADVFHRDGQPDLKSLFWALQDVNFEVAQGEMLGIVGLNGAGKSTLLKILSKITPPSQGQINLQGRIASLLEVGTGFHPELSGRDNIFLNGSILGMSREEINQKFDEIVEFSGVGKFLDTPVKRYSSGMSVRLAFSVAAHLDPEILLLDEVLSVGDAEFQKRSLSKMDDITKQSGRTIIFVSHNLAAIQKVCDRCILLEKGRVKKIGTSKEVVDTYLHTDDLQKMSTLDDLNAALKKLPHDSSFQLKKIVCKQNNQEVFLDIANGAPLDIELHYTVKEKIEGFRLFIDLYDAENNLLFRSFHNNRHDKSQSVISPDDYVSSLTIPSDLLGPLTYEFCVQAGVYNVRAMIPFRAVRVPLHVRQTGKNNQFLNQDEFAGKLGLYIPWQTKKKD